MSGPTLRAYFITERDGSAVVDGDHFAIRLTVKDAPETTRRVTFWLDESYVEPLVSTKNSKGDEKARRDGTYQVEITSYGDFTVVARLHQRGTAKDVILDALLSDMLKESSATDPKLLAAARRIKAN